MIRTALTLAAGLLLQGCMLGPDYVRPEAFAPANWHAPLPHDGKSAALVDWWKQFDDPLVAELIARAEGDSPTLDQALARLKPLFEDDAVLKIAHNMKYDLLVLARYGVAVDVKPFPTPRQPHPINRRQYGNH